MMKPRGPVGKSLIVMVALSSFIGMNATSALAQSDNLASALAYSILSFAEESGSSIVVGNSARAIDSSISGNVGASVAISLGSNSLFGGSVLVIEGVDGITVGNWTKVLGKCGTDNDSPVTLKVGASCGSVSMDGDGFDVVPPVYDSNYFACNIRDATATQSIPGVNITAGKLFTITDEVSGGLNVIDVPSLTLGNSSTLTLSGGSSDTLALRVDGSTSIGNGAKILLAGGLTPSSVVIATQGGISSWSNSATIDGTVLNGLDQSDFDVPTAACTTGSGTTLNGALLCGGDIRLGANSRVNFQPADLVHVPIVCTEPWA
jgi:hypothetical protein